MSPRISSSSALYPSCDFAEGLAVKHSATELYRRYISGRLDVPDSAELWRGIFENLEASWQLNMWR